MQLLLSKIATKAHFRPAPNTRYYYFVRPFVKQKCASPIKKVSDHGVEQSLP
jgi:hypothetical protein